VSPPTRFGRGRATYELKSLQKVVVLLRRELVSLPASHLRKVAADTEHLQDIGVVHFCLGDPPPTALRLWLWRLVETCRRFRPVLIWFDLDYWFSDRDVFPVLLRKAGAETIVAEIFTSDNPNIY